MCTSLEDLEDYNKPQGKAALLKSGIVCCGLVQLPSAVPLTEQLMASIGGGIEIESWSVLPQVAFDALMKGSHLS